MQRTNKVRIIQMLSRIVTLSIFAIFFFGLSAKAAHAEGLTGPNSPSKWDNINKDGGIGSGTELSCHFDNSARVFCENNETATNHNATRYWFNPKLSQAAGHDIFTPSNYGPGEDKMDHPETWGMLHFPESASGNYDLLYISKSATEWEGGTKENDVGTGDIATEPEKSGLSNEFCSIKMFRGSTDKTKTCQAGWSDSELAITATYHTVEPVIKKKCDKGGLGFVLCPIQDMMLDVVTQLNQWLANLLDINTAGFQNATLKQASQNILNLTNAIYALIFLIIIFANGLSIGIDNYTLKKMVPRLVAAIILSQFAFFITGAFIEIGNILGRGVTAFFISLVPETANRVGAGGAVTLGVLTAGAVLVVISMLVIVIIAFLVVLAVLALRWAALYALILIAPLAFAAHVLPNTDKLWKVWWTNLLKLVMMFPIIMAITSGAAFLGAVMVNSDSPGAIQVVGALLPFIGFLMIPKAFKWSGSLMAATGGKLASWGAGKAKGAAKDAWGKEGGYKDKIDKASGGKVPTKLGPLSDFGRKERLKRVGLASSRITKEKEGWTSGMPDSVLYNEARNGKGKTQEAAKDVLKKKYSEELEKQESRASKGLRVDATKLVQLRSALGHSESAPERQQRQVQEATTLGAAADSYVAGKPPGTARPEITYKTNPKDAATETHYYGNGPGGAPIPAVVTAAGPGGTTVVTGRSPVPPGTPLPSAAPASVAAVTATHDSVPPPS